jgi:hypothetical protein
MTVPLELLGSSRDTLAPVEPSLGLELVGVVAPEGSLHVESCNRSDYCRTRFNMDLIRGRPVGERERLTERNNVVRACLKDAIS